MSFRKPIHIRLEGGLNWEMGLRMILRPYLRENTVKEIKLADGIFFTGKKDRDHLKRCKNSNIYLLVEEVLMISKMEIQLRLVDG